MALYYNLPIYKASYKLMVMLFAHTGGFSREYKYTTGQELKGEASALIKNIYRANKAGDKLADIGRARENLEMIRLLTRLMQDFNQLSLKKFVEINQAIEEVSKQLASWEKYYRSNVQRQTTNVQRSTSNVKRLTSNDEQLLEIRKTESVAGEHGLDGESLPNVRELSQMRNIRPNQPNETGGEFGPAQYCGRNGEEINRGIQPIFNPGERLASRDGNLFNVGGETRLRKGAANSADCGARIQDQCPNQRTVKLSETPGNGQRPTSNDERLIMSIKRLTLDVQRSTPRFARTPPELPVARAQASARSKSNNPLAQGKEFCPASGHIAPLHQKNGAINPEVIIPLAGNRNHSSGSLNNQGGNGNYWSSSPSGTNAFNLNFNSTGVNPANTNNRANGFSVRCLKDLQKETIKNGGSQQLLLDLFRAYFDARKHKRSTANALAFEDGYEEKLFKLYEEIINREYKIGQSICFIVDKPVKREIFAADFRDRIVHHLIFNYINPIFENHFIKDSYSCRIGKGTSLGIKRADHFIRSASENYQKDCWILKLDIRGYFMAIDRNILYKKIELKLRTVKNAGFDVDLLLYLIRAVVFHSPIQNFKAKGKREDWVGLPKSKSLFFAPKGKGFPIGNLTSQLFSNIYLDEFDHSMRQKFGIKHYGRYVDDMVFVHSDKDFLKDAVSKIRDYLQEDMGLEMHPKKIYLQHYKKGVYFLGAFVMPYRIYIGKKTKQNFYAKAGMWNQITQKNRGFGGKEESEKFIASVNSYLGLMKHYDTFKLRKKMASNFNGEILESIVFSENFEKVSIY
jgi:hypothetical protein